MINGRNAAVALPVSWLGEMVVGGELGKGAALAGTHASVQTASPVIDTNTARRNISPPRRTPHVTGR